MKRKDTHCPYQLELALSCDAEVAAEHEVVTDDVPAASIEEPAQPAPEPEAKTCEPHLWCDAGWTACVVRNEDGEGWAVTMTKDGETEPALVGPWTMGRDKKNPRPLDATAFATLVKTASEVRRRHEQQVHAMLHKSVVVSACDAFITVTLDIVPDEEHAYATLAAYDEAGAQLAQARVAPTFKLTKASATAWLERGFRQPE